MKITGLGSKELLVLWTLIQERYPTIDTFIIADESTADAKYITATKLIELRNKQDAPLLVLIPSNSRTAAEDSYGNATFKEISLEGIEPELKRQLLKDIPLEFSTVIRTEILGYLGKSCPDANVISYLLSLEHTGYSKEAIGNQLYKLDLLPDAALLDNEGKIRSRLNFNSQSANLLSSFNKPLYDRIAELPLEVNTIQKDLVDFIKAQKQAKSTSEICQIIFEQYPRLNFANWKIPDLDNNQIQIYADTLTSSDFVIEDGKQVLKAQGAAVAKVKVRFSFNRSPKDIPNLHYFKITLMAVNGGAGEEIQVLKKVKNTTAISKSRDVTVDLSPNLLDEGSYFLKIWAEDEHGNILNANDNFKNPDIQEAWEQVTKENPSTLKSSFNYKLTSDTEDFYYVIEDNPDKGENDRKDKLSNVLQAYFKYRIEKLKAGLNAPLPKASQASNLWIADLTKHTSTFYINYSEKHNYQINLSSKLRIIEDLLLQNKRQFGQIKAVLKSNSSALGFQSIQFQPSALGSLIPESLQDLRAALFEKIAQSNGQKNGVLETADVFNFSELIKNYVHEFQEWTSHLGKQIQEESQHERNESNLQDVITEVQALDLVKIKTTLPDGKPTDAYLLSPLHPLRLAWWVELLDLFEKWEKRTLEHPAFQSSWQNNLADLFAGQLSPALNPLVFVEPATFKAYHYTGELAYGWGLYLNVLTEESDNGMTSISRQLKIYFRQLFNITSENFVETDVSAGLVIKHIKNYLAQHAYTDKLIVNLFNAGDGAIFTQALIELEKQLNFENIKYEVRIFKGDDKIIEHGGALKALINPESNISEEAEAFAQPSANRLFPKLRFSINNITDYLKSPGQFTSHLSFLVSPFPLTIELVKPYRTDRNFYLNGLLVTPTVNVEDSGSEIQWNRYILGTNRGSARLQAEPLGISLFYNLQSFIAGALASKPTESIPSTQLRLNDKDKVLLTHLHDYSDWVVTFDKNMGPQIFDRPSKGGKIPFLLDYVPGEDMAGISAYLTTRPTSEILGLLGPHFEEFGVDVYRAEDEERVKMLLEDIRSISSSLALQLNSSKNKAFEVIGSAFTKRVLEKKGFLEESFFIPIDLHHNLFENLQSESKSRADNLLVSIDPETRSINITVIEIKCRKSLIGSELSELKIKMREQIENTIHALRFHFDPEHHLSFDRLDRELKNKEFKSLLTFYMERAYRYEFLSENAYASYQGFLQTLDEGFHLSFKQLGLIFNYSAEKKHLKEVVDHELTFFLFGRKLIDDILDANSDLNTRRLEDHELDEELGQALGSSTRLKPFMQRLKAGSWDAQAQEKVKPSFPEPKDGRVIPVISIPDDHDQEADAPWSIDQSQQEITKDQFTGIAETPEGIEAPQFDILIGKTSDSAQYGILGESIHGKKIAMDLSETNTISLFGVQGGGKSYTIGTISEMVLKPIRNLNTLPAPLAGVIFHYSESMDYEPEFTSMTRPNDKQRELQLLKDRYGASPTSIDDVIILTPKDKLDERRTEYPSLEVLPIAFNSRELSVQDWMFLLGAIGNDSTYIKQLKAIMKELRRELTLEGITQSVEDSLLLTNTQKALARQKLSFAREYVDDSLTLRDVLKPGRLIIVDLRDEFIVKDEALGLFVIMLNIFSAVKNLNGVHFNKFIVFDEAHKYMDNKELTGNIVTAIREMRHKGVSIMIASQDPPSLPNEIIELSSMVLLHKFNSPQWLKHIQKSVTQLSSLTPADMSSLVPGEGFLWATKATDRGISAKPLKIKTRPRVTKHGGATIQATGGK
ncbi:methylation-associated defense system ATP-binding protein MAD8 [Mucilaginibacter lacusdianchii]|uniref:methylation-associated defense system ATP-binding protein MAD8 n=1 Tax=Mucilaginibacter lacusdianchii TaxID=2684211 RepID=UPI00131E38B3|nr:ATP-binding protein [Mucilaginibacter sp. JXJ CY 39]